MRIIDYNWWIQGQCWRAVQHRQAVRDNATRQALGGGRTVGLPPVLILRVLDLRPEKFGEVAHKLFGRALLDDLTSHGQPGCSALLDAMLCYAMLGYAMLVYAVLCYAILYQAILCYAMLCYTRLCYTMQCYVIRGAVPAKTKFAKDNICENNKQSEIPQQSSS